MSDSPAFAILGAGSVGLFLATQLHKAGAKVTLLGRPGRRDPVDRHGLSATRLDGTHHVVPPGDLRWVDSVDSLPPGCSALVCVKSKDTIALAESLARLPSPPSLVVSVQNGLDNHSRLQQRLPDTVVLSAMIPFNLVWDSDHHVVQATSGPIVLDRHRELDPLESWLRAAQLPTVRHADMEGVLRGKLVLNLNNAINALLGIPLLEQLSDRRLRKLLAAAQREALNAFGRAKLSVQGVGRMRPSLAPLVLPLPDAIFPVLARPMIRIHPSARSSMWDDLESRRATEVRDLNGRVVDLCATLGLSAPVNSMLLRKVEDAEQAERGSPRLSVDALLRGL